MKKEALMKAYEEVKGKIELVILPIRMPDGKTQTLESSDVEEIINYVDKAYDEDLVNVNCSKIYIENYIFMLKGAIGNFGEAIAWLKAGRKVARKGWNGKGMYLYLVHGTTVDKENLRNEASQHLPNDEMAMHGTGVAEFLPHIDMRTANGDVCIGWLASQADMLADDWVLIE